MSKNVVFMTAVRVPGKESRSSSYETGRASFQHWCDKNNCELVVLDELLFPNDQMRVNYHRYYCFDLLEDSGIDYDQILLTDADAIIDPDCPNFFEMSEGKYTVTRCDGNFDWICRSKENYENVFGELGDDYPLWNYFNGGFQIVNKKHKELFKGFVDFYWENAERVNWMQDNFGVGTDQALLNYYVRTQDVEMKYLPYKYCMADLPSKNLMGNDLLFTRMKGIYQFNAMPDEQRKLVMDITWNKLKED